MSHDDICQQVFSKDVLEKLLIPFQARISKIRKKEQSDLSTQGKAPKSSFLLIFRKYLIYVIDANICDAIGTFITKAMN